MRGCKSVVKFSKKVSTRLAGECVGVNRQNVASAETGKVLTVDNALVSP
jgi:hypothetical protein